MDASVAPVRRGARDVVLLDGDAFSTIVRAARREESIRALCERLDPLKLFIARPEDAFDPIKDANYFVVDVDALNHRLEKTLSSVVIVDVSPGSVPRVIPFDSAEHEHVSEQIALCKHALKQAAADTKGVSCLLPDGKLDSVFLGVLLGYPVVYL